jgi:hypothetical protein
MADFQRPRTIINDFVAAAKMAAAAAGLWQQMRE